jgi:hypothetical protein
MLFHYRDSGAAVQLIKGGSSYRIHKERGDRMEIWQVGFHDWTIRDGEDWKAKANYIHMNPVKARLCERAEDWPYASLNGRFCLDSVPEKYTNLPSGAKAQDLGAVTQGLKPLPPNEGSDPDASTGTVAGAELTPLVSKEPGS